MKYMCSHLQLCKQSQAATSEMCKAAKHGVVDAINFVLQCFAEQNTNPTTSMHVMQHPNMPTTSTTFCNVYVRVIARDTDLRRMSHVPNM